MDLTFNLIDVLLAVGGGAFSIYLYRIRKLQSEVEERNQEEKKEMKGRIERLEDQLPELVTEVSVLSATLTSVIQTSLSAALKPIEERLRNIEIDVAKVQTTLEGQGH